MGNKIGGLKKIDQKFFHGKMKAFYRRHMLYQNKAYHLTEDLYFPPHTDANKEVRLGPLGELLAIGGDLSLERMIFSYKNGIDMTISKDEPILWWTSEGRCVLFPPNIHISKGARRFIERNTFRFTVDQVFEKVVDACSEERTGLTWLTPERKDVAYKLYQQGIAHSIELWQDDNLIAGNFGVAFGAYFLSESKFSRVSNAGKAATIALALRLKELHYNLYDMGIWPTDHLISMGAEVIPREEFHKILKESLEKPDIVKEWDRLFENWDLKSAVEKHRVERTLAWEKDNSSQI
ncbi:leucyl/phenylalanyl-tRNA--protein transferase [Eubacteriaceae bacterium ES3]|nr:leucyl/phenylalanyl-tRNA--protein transferase [Eubacteriaceae bacterium ES3]